jgi:hypothetical protein
MKRLSTSLPVPVGPLIRTGISLAASRSASASTDRLSGSAAIGIARRGHAGQQRGQRGFAGAVAVAQAMAPPHLSRRTARSARGPA